MRPRRIILDIYDIDESQQELALLRGESPLLRRARAGAAGAMCRDYTLDPPPPPPPTMGTDVRSIITNPRRARQGARRKCRCFTRDLIEDMERLDPVPACSPCFGRSLILAASPCSGLDHRAEGSVAGKPFRLGKKARSRKFVYGAAGGDCHGLLGDELKGTDHFADYREFAGLRLHNGRVFQMPSGGNESPAPDVIALVNDASDDRCRADQVQRWHLGVRAEPLP